MVPNFPFLSPEARGPWSEDRVAAAEVPWSERMEKVSLFREFLGYFLAFIEFGTY